MTAPSTEELQRLLDQATPGEWIKGVEMNTGEITIATTDMDAPRLTVLDSSNCTVANASLIALAPELAAEVIRLRKSIETLASGLEKRASKTYQQRFGHIEAEIYDTAADEIRSTLEADQHGGHHPVDYP